MPLPIVLLVSLLAPATAPSPVIDFLEMRVADDPLDIRALNRLVGEYLTRFRETGDDADLDRALATAEKSLTAIPADLNPGGLAARARAAFSLHRFAAARDDATLLARLQPNKRYPLEFLGDALFELGDLDDAKVVYAKVEAFPDTEPDPATEIRLARLAVATGHLDEAKRRYNSAVELARAEHVPPETLVWALVSAGGFDFSRGRWDAAEARYLEALKLKPDDWPAQDRLAELRAAQGRFDESVAAYRKLVERIPRPELFQSLGDVYREMKSPDEAKQWHQRALAAYRKAADAGSSHYYHHLAGYYCDVESNPTEAVRLAREDLKVRRTSHAYDTLAWALYHSNDFAGAAEAIDAALKPGVADAHILHHASLIYARVGRAADARSALRRAGEVNPKFMSFHVHR